MEEDWGGVITNTGPRTCREATPMVILITDGVGGENLGMVTIFCPHNQNKMEASDALSTLCQCDSPEPSIVVKRKYTNTPLPQCQYSPGALPPSSSLWTTYASEGYFHTPRPRCSYFMKKGRLGLKYTPTPERFYGKPSKRGTISLTQCHYQSPCLLYFPV